jgi:predicted dinucleotide-binding enzyme
MTAAITIGVIGVGHLVRHMMPALVTGGHRFILSARNRETAAELARRFRLEIVEDNAEIVARCDIVILAVRPYDAIQVAGNLTWRAEMTVLLGLEELRRHDAFGLWRDAADTVACHLSGANEPEAVKAKAA